MTKFYPVAMSEKTSTKDHGEIQETESLDRPLPSSISIPGESLGADSSADLPKNYFKSWQFNAVLLVHPRLQNYAMAA